MTTEYDKIHDYVAFAADFNEHLDDVNVARFGDRLFAALSSRFEDGGAFRASFVTAVKSVLGDEQGFWVVAGAGMESNDGYKPWDSFSRSPLAAAVHAALMDAADVGEAATWDGMRTNQHHEFEGPAALHFLAGLYDTQEDVMAAANELHGETEASPGEPFEWQGGILSVDITTGESRGERRVTLTAEDFVRTCLSMRGIEHAGSPAP